MALTIALGTLTSCEQENDELFLQEEVSVKQEKETEVLARRADCDTRNYAHRDAQSGTDYNSAVGTLIDDRSCSYNYYQWSNFGVYKLRGSDNAISSGDLQTRMERTTPKQAYGNGKYVYIDGALKISNAGVTNASRASRTYDDMGDDNGS